MAEHMAEQDRRAKVPKAKIDPTPASAGTAASRGRRPQEEPAPTAAPQPPLRESDPATEEGASFRRARQGIRSWVHETFPGHENAVIWGFIGFLVALLFFVIGFWRTLLVVLMVAIGVAFGQVLDGDPKIINTLRGLFRGDDGR